MRGWIQGDIPINCFFLKPIKIDDMKIIDETSNAGRQIVPEDMNYLSLVDREVVAAIGGMVQSMFGLDESMAVVVSGCEVSFVPQTLDSASLYTMNNGVVLWHGLLWDVDGIEVKGGGATPLVFNRTHAVVFEREKVVAPSPVYGMTRVLDQTPHKMMTARVAHVDAVPKSAESVPLSMVVRLPKIGVARGINNILAQVTNTEREETA